MKNNKEIYHNIKWWKFSDYVWEENDKKGLHIKPHPDSVIEEYNPWEVNDTNTSGRYPIPIYGELIRDCLDLTFEYVALISIGHGSDTLKKKHKISNGQFENEQFENERRILLLRQRLKEKIYSFVKKYGLLGFFWHKANRVIHQSIYIPNLVKKKKFETSKNNYFYITEETKLRPELEWYLPPLTDSSEEENLRDKYNYDKLNFDKRGLIEKYLQTKKVPKGYKVEGFFIGHIVERYSKGGWDSKLLISNLNDEGLNYLKKFNETKFHEHFLKSDIFPDSYLSKSSIAGVYYNENHTSSKVKGTTSLYNNVTDEYFIPYEEGCVYFPDEVIQNPLFTVGTRYKLGTTKIIQAFQKNYSERFDDFLQYIIELQTMTLLEEKKSNMQNKIAKDELLDAVLNKKYVYDATASFNFLLNKYQDRNLIVSDYSNKNNPYSFTSASFSGYLANMLLWDVIGGKRMKSCSNPKCKKYYFDPGNKLNCSDSCRQVTARKRRKENLLLKKK